MEDVSEDVQGSVDAVADDVQEGVSLLRRPFNAAGKAVKGVYSGFVEKMNVVMQNVPTPVIVALISTVSTVMGSKIKSSRDAQSAKRQEQQQAEKRRREIEQQLRKSYAELAAPILKSAAKLAERIQMLVATDWYHVEKPGVKNKMSSAYSAYLLGRYLACVEILKRENALLDYGFPAADRILANILGRVQGVLSASDNALMTMQETEHLFQPPPGQDPLLAGPLRITPRAQAVLGELLQRKLWSEKYDFVDKVDDESLMRGPKAVLSFLEFTRLLQDEPTAAAWYNPVVEEFEKLERSVKRIPREKRRCNELGARLYFLQSGLLDLVEFFDPLPQAQRVPFYRRRRLRLGQEAQFDQQRAPLSLHLLYNELANVRDHRVVPGDARQRLRLPHGGVEVHVKAAAKVPGKEKQNRQRHGDCPYSQRVLIVLEEMGVPYQQVFIPSDSKPAWYYLLHPENRTPVVYDAGNLVEDSRHIIAYLMDRFPQARRLPSTSKIGLAAGTGTYTLFHDRFVSWMSGNDAARADLDHELLKLEKIVQSAQEQQENAPFLGGKRFAREDTAIVPMLHNVAIAGKEVLNYEFPQQCVALRRYLAAARKVSSFKKTVADDRSVVIGYSKLKQQGGEREWVLSDMLE